MTAAVCRECGASLSPRGGCPRCLLALGIAGDGGRTGDGGHGDGAGHDGQRFGRYQLLDRLGRGAMGVVWKARDLKLDRVVALKLIAAGRFADATEVDRFRKEAQAAARLSHPNAVPVHDVGEHDGQPYFTMELVEGQTLAELVRDVPLAPERAAGYVRAVADAIAAAHALDIVHRDLKPSNVIVDRQDRARVTDFGLARRVDLAADASLPAAVGTPSYMSPEQAASRPADRRSDVYGLGATLYELVTGRPPFLAASAIDTLRQVIEADPAPPRLLNRKVPPDLQTLCLTCLAKEPERRYQTATALSEELGRFLAGKPIQARPLSRAARLARWAGRNPALATLAGLLAGLLALLAVAAVLTRQDTVQANAFAARGVASSLLLRLRAWGDRLPVAAADPALVAAARARDKPAMERRLAALGASGTLPSDTIFMLDQTGRGFARWPRDDRFMGVDSSGRDYFKGTLRHGPGDPLHVSAAYQSQIDHRLKFALASPVRGPGGDLLAVLVASSTTDDTLGVSGLQADVRKVVVVGPLDPNRTGAVPWSFPPDARYVVVVHPAYRHGDAAVAWGRDQRHWLDLPGRHGADLDPRTETWPVGGVHFDPVGARHRRYRGPWVAGIAPVGQTGFVVVVQSRDWVLLSVLIVGAAAAGAGLLLLARRVARRPRP
jgi:eukaryotic-like serine/threonine-protein kinase